MFDARAHYFTRLVWIYPTFTKNQNRHIEGEKQETIGGDEKIPDVAFASVHVAAVYDIGEGQTTTSYDSNDLLIDDGKENENRDGNGRGRKPSDDNEFYEKPSEEDVIRMYEVTGGGMKE